MIFGGNEVLRVRWFKKMIFELERLRTVNEICSGNFVTKVIGYSEKLKYWSLIG